MRRLGLYVHFPWCRARCPYCDFAIAVAPLEEIPHQRYADAVIEELAVRQARFAGRELVSIYFGGGTPALWEPREMGRVIEAGVAAFGRQALAEVTCEANPLDCTPDRLRALRDVGVDRLSLGAQSVADADLVQLGRDHDAGAALRAITTAREAGFSRLSVDLIYAVPGLTRAGWERTLARIIDVAPEHLSLYQLTVEERTPLAESVRKGRVVPATDEVSAEQFELAHERLSAAGYEHYEVSAYAKPGHRAVHNSLYWSGGEYLGIGNGAHAFWRDEAGGGIRWSGHRSVQKWLAGRLDPVLEHDGRIAEITRQDAEELAADAVWLALRTRDGVAVNAVDAAAAEACVAAGLLRREGDRFTPTPRGLLMADELGVRLS